MTLTERQRLDCEQYVLDGSWRCRQMPRRSRRLVRRCLDFMPLHERHGEKWLRAEMAREARLQTKSAAVLWLILKFVLPVLIKLVVEWWLKQRRSEA